MESVSRIRPGLRTRHRGAILRATTGHTANFGEASKSPESIWSFFQNGWKASRRSSRGRRRHPGRAPGLHPEGCHSQKHHLNRVERDCWVCEVLFPDIVLPFRAFGGRGGGRATAL